MAIKLAGVEGEPTQDVASQAEVHALTGGVSTAGLLLWGATAGAAAMSGLVLARLGRGEVSRFFLVTAAGIGCFGLDDALLLHEDVIPNQLGLAEPVLYVLAVAAILVWGARFRAVIVESDLALLALVALAGVLMVGVDALDLWSMGGEDWLKYVGLIALTGWVVDLSLRQFGDERPLSALRRKREPGDATPPPAR